MVLLASTHYCSLSFKPKPPQHKTSFATRSRIAKTESPDVINMNDMMDSMNLKQMPKYNHDNTIMFKDGLKHSRNENVFAHNLSQKASVDSATRHWMSVVSSGLQDAPQLTTELYTSDAVIWGTVSEDLRKGQHEILQYFEFFARQKQLSVVPGSYKSHIQLFGDVAISSGYYTFQFLDDASVDSDTNKYKVVPARFTFIFERQYIGDKVTIPEWKIVNHHSSVIPEQPIGLVPIGV